MDTEALKEIAKQLSQPEGKKGIEIADMMNETNQNMTLHSIRHLNISEHDTLLELGHGNCKHLPFLLQQHFHLSYFGLETSALMHREAQQFNQALIEQQKARFYLYDGKVLPFEDNFFNKIFTVNTLYFWNDPTLMLSELYRVLQSEGRLVITYAQQDFMQKLPFTQYGFTLYDNHQLMKLIKDSPFKTAIFNSEIERISNNNGELIEREFTSCQLIK